MVGANKSPNLGIGTQDLRDFEFDATLAMGTYSLTKPPDKHWRAYLQCSNSHLTSSIDGSLSTPNKQIYPYCYAFERDSSTIKP